MNHARLLAYAAGALDPAEREAVERWLASPAGEALPTIPGDDPPLPRWRLPPPGLGVPVLTTRVATLGAASPSLRVTLPPGSPVVLLRATGEDWEVEGVHPGGAALVLSGEVSWAIAIPDADWRIEDDPAGHGLRQGIAEGRFAVARLPA